MLTVRCYSEPMKISLKIFLLTIFLLWGVASMAQVAQAPDDSREGKVYKTEPGTDTRNANLSEESDQQTQSTGNKRGSVKQVKSARPDMSRSRGARPPDIVRPSGSRIPKGVGRPAGAVRHGRG